ncbi:MAG: hypothetical protein ACE5I1_24485 [bacterium]
MKTPLRTVPDTNVIVARQNASAKSPNQEYFKRWESGEFELLYADDTLREYNEKLLEKSVPRENIIQRVVAIQKLGIYISILPLGQISHRSRRHSLPVVRCKWQCDPFDQL